MHSSRAVVCAQVSGSLLREVPEKNNWALSSCPPIASQPIYCSGGVSIALLEIETMGTKEFFGSPVDPPIKWSGIVRSAYLLGFFTLMSSRALSGTLVILLCNS